ncbi:MAG: 2-isopropylmalate synthase [Methylophaga sp.]|uniref:2-isopropylmalate synthase n=1 Tax=unclassified Methylophaga TaxID=2629249 RepID=UPI000C414253|nr:2-isopropylmalate synthase [Methylophaga sp. UBA678]MAX52472.1 2-isopropylmalate synthase [Methylophaga sp.]|tara:strand:- start:100760 stop:102457 length:1698 start_codon:yes stop_codon:yes gene_type:complete
MISQPAQKYRRFDAIQLPDRRWPNVVLDKAPIWMSTDLRDGNQALIDPMSVDTKMRFFLALVDMGFKEIEVGFPSASETDFNFVRRLIDENRIPDDVTIEVLTQAREDLIARTVESLKGAKRAILHMYNPIAPAFREIVYRTDKAGVKEIAERGTRWVKEMTAKQPETEWVYQYSPETFSSAEMEFAKEVCDAVTAIWQPTPEHKMIINLPATVEMATPNTYADQVEWMHRHLNQRDSIILSVHPHNDRGTAVAAAELAVMAGADRVEGCLFGNGERTGNVDLITLAMNLYSQGIHPELDFTQMDQIRQLFEEATQLPVHPRHPYAGELVFTAFSGSHQDAIKKGLAVQKADDYWQVPYLPIDPADVNRSYDAVVRVNSQSGKGGVSFLLQQHAGFELPRRLQIEFSKVVQKVSDSSGREINAENIVSLFDDEYVQVNSPYQYMGSHIVDEESHQVMSHVVVKYEQQRIELKGQGNGPLDAVAKAISEHIGETVTVADYHEHGMTAGSDATAVSYVEVKVGEHATVFGVGQDKNITTSAIKALLNGVNRFMNTGTSVAVDKKAVS